eukprot:scaffold2113_cov233-Pinguiococcus_pyrenoidosus.AAC.22
MFVTWLVGIQPLVVPVVCIPTVASCFRRRRLPRQGLSACSLPAGEVDADGIVRFPRCSVSAPSGSLRL